MLRDSQLPPFDRTRCNMCDGERDGATAAVCRLVAGHPDPAAAQLLVREQTSFISHMAVGTTLGLGSAIRPVQHIADFLLARDCVSLSARLMENRSGPRFLARPKGNPDSAPASEFAPLPADVEAELTVPLIRLAWVINGDQGNLFNVEGTACEPQSLPYIAAALTSQSVRAHYGHVLGQQGRLEVTLFSAPGINALNFVVRYLMESGILSSTWIDPLAMWMAQSLLNHPALISEALSADRA